MEVIKPRGRINQFTIIGLGSIIVCLSVITYYYILRGVFGQIPDSSFVPGNVHAASLLMGAKPKIAILYSKYTENTLPPGSTWLNDNLNIWGKFLTNNGYKYSVLADSNIEQGKHNDFDILILMGAKSLSDKEIIQIKKYLDNGGSVFATSGIATFSDDGKWRGWEFFSQVFGLKFSREIETDEVTKIHTLRGELPITANIPIGYPLKIATWDRPIAAEVLDPRTIQVSFWYNFKTQDGLSREEIKKTAGIAYGNYNLGRFVWLGFELNSIIGIQEDYVLFDRMFRNCINWLAYQPIAFVKEWPGNYQAAAVITPVVMQNPNNVTNILPILNNEKVQASFFVDPIIAKNNRDLVKSLVKYGEVGAVVDIGYLAFINDTINKLNDLNTQTVKMTNAANTIKNIIGREINGIYPMFGIFDNNTPKALINSGLKFVFTDSLTDRSVPKVFIRDGKRVVSMTKTARDDYEVIRDLRLNEKEFQFYTYQEDIDRILFEGGLYVFKMSTDFQCRPENAEVLQSVIRDLKQKKFWITTADEIQKWYLKKNYIELRVDRKGLYRISLVVSNPGKEVYPELKVQVVLNDNILSLSLKSELIGVATPDYKFNKEDNTITLVLKDFKAGESRTFVIDYTRPNS